VKTTTSSVASLICPLPRRGTHPTAPACEPTITIQSEAETLFSAESSAKLLVVQKPKLMTGIDSTLLWQHDFVHVVWDVLDVPDNVSTMAIRANA
jgi:hypothetical protein